MPNLDDDDNNGQESAVERFRKKLSDLEENDGDADEDSPSVPLIASKGEDEDGDIPVVQTRNDKKRERLKLKEAYEETRRENSELAQRLARLEGAQSAMAAQRGRVDNTEDVDPYQAELTRLQDEHSNAYKALQAKGNAATEADRDAYTKKARDIEAKKLDVGVSRVLAQRGIQAQTPQAALQAVLAAENQDVYANERATQYAKSYFNMQISMGHADNRELFDRSMNAAREAFKMTPRGGQPSESRKRQFEGAPRGNSGRSSVDAEETVTMTKPLRAMARAKYPGLSEEEAYVKWARTVGPGYLADVARSKKG